MKTDFKTFIGETEGYNLAIQEMINRIKNELKIWKVAYPYARFALEAYTNKLLAELKIMEIEE